MIVKPDTFARRMSEHWEAPPLSNVTSDSLEAAWADMADTFNRHIAGKVKNRWSILQLPTGTGKIAPGSPWENGYNESFNGRGNRTTGSAKIPHAPAVFSFPLGISGTLLMTAGEQTGP